MKNISIADGKIQGSEIALGCMRIAQMNIEEVESLIKTSMD
ncbi:hypothetical protein [Clostridium sp.]|nr:hypothetical protein [Clostridium sp.]